MSRTMWRPTPLARAGGLAAVVALALGACAYAPTPMPSASSAAARPSSAAAGATCDPAGATRSYAPDGLPAADNLPSGSSMAAIRKRGRLIVGVSADTYLLGARDPISGQIQGFDIDVARELARRILGDPSRLETVVITAADRLPVLSKVPSSDPEQAAQATVEVKDPSGAVRQVRPVDVVIRNMTITCDRWTKIAFSADYYNAGQKILARKPKVRAKGAPEPSPADILATQDTTQGLEALRGGTIKVCAPAGTSSLTNIRTKKVPDSAIVTASNHTGCLVLFQKGDVDAITGDDTVLAGLAAQDPYAVVLKGKAFSAEPYGIGVNSGRRDLVRFINAVLEQMHKDGSWQKSYDTWLRPALGPGSQPTPEYGR